MQWTSVLSWLAAVRFAVAVAATSAAGTKCHYLSRSAATVDELQKTNWENVDYNSTFKLKHRVWACKDGEEKMACAHWLRYGGGSHGWYEHADGCPHSRVHWDTRSKAAVQYCDQAKYSGCVSTQYLAVSKERVTHQPAALCCCFTDYCYTPEIYDFSKKAAAAAVTVKPWPKPAHKFKCEWSMRVAVSLDELRHVEPIHVAIEYCETPCVEFVYWNAYESVWRRWRAGCSYKYGMTYYTDIVSQFCTTSEPCAKFDMIEPTSRADDPPYRWTEAYACCCYGADCDMPDTIAAYQGMPHQTWPLRVTATAKPNATQPAPTMHATAPAAASDNNRLLWFVVVITVVFVIILIFLIAILVVFLRRRTKKARRKRKKPRAAKHKPVLPPQPTAPHSSTKKGQAKATAGNVAPKAAAPTKSKLPASKTAKGVDTPKKVQQSTVGGKGTKKSSDAATPYDLLDDPNVEQAPAPVKPVEQAPALSPPVKLVPAVPPVVPFATVPPAVEAPAEEAPAPSVVAESSVVESSVAPTEQSSAAPHKFGIKFEFQMPKLSFPKVDASLGSGSSAGSASTSD